MKFALFLSLFCISLSISAQEYMIQKSGDIYFYQGKSYKRVELGDIYQSYQPSFDLYSAGIKDKNRSKVLAWSGLGLLAGGVLLVVDVRNNSFGDDIPVIKIGLSLAALAGGFALELAAIATSVQGSDRIEMARDVFNLEMSRTHGYKTQGSVSLAVTPNGVGFVVSF